MEDYISRMTVEDRKKGVINPIALIVLFNDSISSEFAIQRKDGSIRYYYESWGDRYINFKKIDDILIKNSNQWREIHITRVDTDVYVWSR